MASGDSQGHPNGYGWWTKRITYNQAYILLEQMERLFFILEQCHNLQTFVISSEQPLPPLYHTDLTQILESRFSHSLRRLQNHAQSVPFIDCTEVIPSVNGLKSLGLRPECMTPVDGPFKPSFECITSLTIFLPYTRDTLLPRWVFPSLQNLSLWNVTPNHTFLAPFVKEHQTTLRHLDVITGYMGGRELSNILSNTPHLRSLAIPKSEIHALESWIRMQSGSNRVMDKVLLPKLSHLGFRFDGMPRDYSCGWGLECLEKILECEPFPELKVVRLLDTDAHRTVRQCNWEDIKQQCLKYGVQFEYM